MKTPRAAGIYVHVPFCRSICAYCDFPRVQADVPPTESYTRAVVAEILGYEDPAEDASGFETRGALTVYFGGGTPSQLDPPQVGRIVDAVARRFALVEGAEVTLEANPGDLDVARVRGYRAAGVNRLSLGVQSFRDAFLRFLDRRHTAAEARAAFDAAREGGIDNVSIDLIYGLPDQTAAMWREDLEEARRWAPAHLSAYALSMEEGSHLTARWRAGEVAIPGDEEAEAMWLAFEDAAPWLDGYEISNFTLDGRRAEHNGLYWRWMPYLGFGAAAHSFLPDAKDGGLRWSNAADPGRYMAAVGEGSAPSGGSERLTARTALADYILTRLRVREGFGEDDFALRFGAPFDALAGPRLARWVDAGLLRRRAGRVQATRRGWFVSNGLFGDVVSTLEGALTSIGATSTLEGRGSVP